MPCASNFLLLPNHSLHMNDFFHTSWSRTILNISEVIQMKFLRKRSHTDCQPPKASNSNRRKSLFAFGAAKSLLEDSLQRWQVPLHG